MPPLVSNISLSHRRRYGIQKELKERNLEQWQSNETFWAVLFYPYCLFSLSWAVQIVQTLESVNENLSCDQFGNFWVSEQTLSVIIWTKHFWYQLFVFTVFILILWVCDRNGLVWPFNKNPFKELTFSSFWKQNINSGWEKHVAQWLGYTLCILHVCPYFNSL